MKVKIIAEWEETFTDREWQEGQVEERIKPYKQQLKREIQNNFFGENVKVDISVSKSEVIGKVDAEKINEIIKLVNAEGGEPMENNHPINDIHNIMEEWLKIKESK